LIEYFDDTPLSELTKDRLQGYFEYRLRNVSAYAVKRDIANLSSAFNWGTTKRYLHENICRGIKKPKIPQRLPLYFSEEEFHHLLRFVENVDLKDIITFAVYTGLRQGDLINLEWRQINFKDRTLILDNRSSVTKSGKVHTLPLSIEALQILTEREKNKTLELIFTYRGERIKQDFISKKFRKFVKKAELNIKLTFHSLRHTFGSWLVQRGVPIYQVSLLMPHSDTRVTQIYTHLTTNNLAEAIKNISNN